jgi:hypothetical protein
MTDRLPGSVRFTSVTSSAGSCQQQAGTVVCAIGSLAQGGTVEIRISVVPRRPGTITNTVTVAGAENDPASANNVDVERTRVAG